VSATVREEPPTSEEAQALLSAREEESSRLYPPESQHHIPAGDHAREDVRFFVVREAGAAIGCGALELHPDYAEMKSVYIAPHARGRRLGAAIIHVLEAEALRLGFDCLRLETGVRSPWAIRTYERAGYRRRGPFGVYPDDPLSVFMEKRLESEG
jgi:putative acetyltransferase